MVHFQQPAANMATSLAGTTKQQPQPSSARSKLAKTLTRVANACRAVIGEPIELIEHQRLQPKVQGADVAQLREPEVGDHLAEPR